MVSYEYLKKIKTNGNFPVAIIDFLSNFIKATSLRFIQRLTRYSAGQRFTVKGP